MVNDFLSRRWIWVILFLVCAVGIWSYIYYSNALPEKQTIESDKGAQLLSEADGESKQTNSLSPEFIEKIKSEDFLWPSFIAKLDSSNPDHEVVLPLLEQRLDLYKKQIKQSKGIQTFFGSIKPIDPIDKSNSSSKTNKWFFDITLDGSVVTTDKSLEKSDSTNYTILKIAQTETALRTIEGDTSSISRNQWRPSEPASLQVENLSDLGIPNMPKDGDSVWLWIYDSRSQITDKFVKINAVIRTPFEISLSGAPGTFIRWIVERDENFKPGISDNERYADYYGGIALLSFQPFPEQIWKIGDISPADKAVAVRTMEKLHMEYTEMELEDIADGYASIMEATTTIIQTKQYGDFMIIRGMGIAMGDGSIAVATILRRENSWEPWSQFSATYQTRWSIPFLDVNNDGVPEFLHQAPYFYSIEDIFSRQASTTQNL